MLLAAISGGTALKLRGLPAGGPGTWDVGRGGREGTSSRWFNFGSVTRCICWDRYASESTNLNTTHLDAKSQIWVLFVRSFYSYIKDKS